jgi:hypothetical protein
VKLQEGQAEQAGQADRKGEVEKRVPLRFLQLNKCYFFVYFLGGLEFVGHSFAYVAHFVFLKDVWIRTHTAGVASRRATNLATHLSNVILVRNIFKSERSVVDFFISYPRFSGCKRKCPSFTFEKLQNPIDVDEI